MRTVLVKVRPEGGDLLRVGLAVRDAAGSAWAEIGGHTVSRDALHGRALPLVGDVTNAAMEAAGAALFDLVVAGREAELWAPGAETRLLLDICPDLHGVPWELLQASRQRWLFSAPAQPATRVRGPLDAAPPPLCAPVELLVVVGDIDPAVGGADEVAAIYEAVSDVPACWNVEVLYEPTVAALRKVFAKSPPDILHFVGHGAAPGGQPALVVNDEDGAPWHLTAAFVTNALHGTGARLPRLVMLNACRTGGPGGGAAVRGVGDAFLDHGALAVVTTQGDIAVGPSVEFTRALYQRIAHAEPVDVAVAAARNAVQWGGPGFHERDWALPVLTVKTEPPDVLRVVRAGDPRHLLQKTGSASDVILRIVDRCDVRRDIWRWIVSPEQDRRDLLLLSGGGDTGKTAIAQWTVLASRTHGKHAVHVDLDPTGGRLDWEPLLRTLVARIEEVVPGAEEPAAAFRDALDRITGHLTEGLPGAPPAPDVTAAVAFELLAGDLRPRRPTDYLDEAFGHFQTFVKAAVPDGELVVILDPFDTLLDKQSIVTRLVAPAATGKLRPLRLVIVDRTFHQELPAHFGVHVPVPPFRRDDLVHLAREFCVRIRGQSDYVTFQPSDRQWRTLVGDIEEWAVRRSKPDRNDTVLATELTMAELQARQAAGVR